MILDDLVTLIENASALEFGATLFAAGLPDTPDACVAMIEVGGRPGMHVFGLGAPAIEHPRVRIAVRGEPNMYEEPRALIEAIYQALAARPNEVNGARYLTWEPIQPPYVLGKDKNDRWVLGFNVEAWKEVSA